MIIKRVHILLAALLLSLNMQCMSAAAQESNAADRIEVVKDGKRSQQLSMRCSMIRFVEKDSRFPSCSGQKTLSGKHSPMLARSERNCQFLLFKEVRISAWYHER